MELQVNESSSDRQTYVIDARQRDNQAARCRPTIGQTGAVGRLAGAARHRTLQIRTVVAQV